MSARNLHDHAEYLGDAVYASFDGYHIWLATGDENKQCIALEPAVFRALIAYEKRIREQLGKAIEKSEVA